MIVKKSVALVVGLLWMMLSACPPALLGPMTLTIEVPEQGIIRLNDTKEVTIRWELFIEGGVPASDEVYPRSYSIYLHKGGRQVEVIAEDLEDTNSFTWKNLHQASLETGDDYRIAIKTQDYSQNSRPVILSDYFKIDTRDWKHVRTYDSDFPLMSAGVKIQDDQGNKLLVGYREVDGKKKDDTRRLLRLHALEGTEEANRTQFPEKDVNAYSFDVCNGTDYVFYSGNGQSGSYLIKGQTYDNPKTVETHNNTSIENLNYTHGPSIAICSDESPGKEVVYLGYYDISQPSKICVKRWDNKDGLQEVENNEDGIPKINLEAIDFTVIPIPNPDPENSNTVIHSPYSTSLTLDSIGTPYLAFQVKGYNQIFVYTWKNSKWNLLSTGLTENSKEARFPSLICDSMGYPVILYTNEKNFLVVKRWDEDVSSWKSLEYPENRPVTYQMANWGGKKIKDQFPTITTAGDYLIVASSHGIMAYDTTQDNHRWVDLGYPNAPSGGMGKVSQWVDGNSKAIAAAFIDEKGSVQVWKLDISGGIKWKS